MSQFFEEEAALSGNEEDFEEDYEDEDMDDFIDDDEEVEGGQYEGPISDDLFDELQNKSPESIPPTPKQNKKQLKLFPSPPPLESPVLDIQPTIQQEDVRTPFDLNEIIEKMNKPQKTQMVVARKQRILRKPIKDTQKIGYQFIKGKIRIVKKDPKNRYPIPFTHRDSYPVYSVNQLEDLNFLLQNGELSKGLIGKIHPIYKNGKVVNFTGDITPPWFIEEILIKDAIIFLQNNPNDYPVREQIVKDFNLLKSDRSTVLKTLNSLKTNHNPKPVPNVSYNDTINEYMFIVKNDPTLDTSYYIDMFNRLNISYNIPTPTQIIKKLKTIRPFGGMTEYYTEEEFIDTNGITIMVKEGVQKNRIIWANSDWDPCNYFSKAEINYRIINTVTYLRSQKFKILPYEQREGILSKIIDHWKLGTNLEVDEIIKNLLKLKNSNVKSTRCLPFNKYNCTWNDPTKTCHSNIALEVDKPFGQPKKKFKESVWEWKVPGMPTNKTSQYYKHNLNVWKKQPYVQEWMMAVQEELDYLKEILKTTRVSTNSFNLAKHNATLRLEKIREKLDIPEIEKKKKPFTPKFRPNVDLEGKLYTLNGRVPEDSSKLKEMLRYGAIIITNEALNILNKLKNKNYNTDSLFNNYKCNKLIPTLENDDFTETSSQIPHIINIIRNMAFTHTVEIPRNMDIDPSNVGSIYDTLVIAIDNGLVPDPPVTITHKDVLEYLGDSNYQYYIYNPGVIQVYQNTQTVDRYLIRGCQYEQLDLTMENPRIDSPFVYMNRYYVVGRNLHSQDIISTSSARRLSLILGVNLADLPPCFSSKPTERNNRVGSVITEEDVNTYFIRGGSNYYTEELSFDDVKHNRQKREYWNSIQQKLEEKRKKYKKALKEIIKGESNISELSKKYILDYFILKKLSDEMEEIEDSQKRNYIRNVEIPFYINKDREKLRKELEQKFENTYGFPLSEFLINPRYTRDERVIDLTNMVEL